jgi:CelD/BcsL family acetyltransferase involved in cellulose biosynthesis
MIEKSEDRFAVTVVEHPAQLLEHAAHWEDLAAQAIEPNPFYEPWMLLPAIEAFGADLPLIFVLVYARSLGKPPRLAGLFPLERCARYRGIPVPYFRLWRHPHCFLRTPLLRRSHARGCVDAFLDWLADTRAAAMMEWGAISADGPFHGVLAEVLNETRRPSFLAHGFERALLQRRADGETYVREVLSARRRKEFRRLERRLGECGALRYDVLDPAAAAQGWIEEFIALEVSGWKGRHGSALGCSARDRRFFTVAALEAARRRRLMMLALRLDGRAVAMKCNFLAGDAGYAFKIAHDERYAQYSPGALLELEHVHEFHRRPDLRWIDSCAEPDHFMINRFWLDRRGIAKLLTNTGRASGQILLASLPLLRRMRDGLRSSLPA